jgi:hypothetical protein
MCGGCAHFPRAYMQLHSASCVKMQGKVFRAVWARALYALQGGGRRLRNSVRSQGQGNVFRKRILSRLYYFRVLVFLKYTSYFFRKRSGQTPQKMTTYRVHIFHDVIYNHLLTPPLPFPPNSFLLIPRQLLSLLPQTFSCCFTLHLLPHLFPSSPTSSS